MRKLLGIAFLVFLLGTLTVPADAGVTAGGRPYLPGEDLPVGGVTAGGRPFVPGGGVFTPTGFGFGAQFYDEGWEAESNPYWGGGGWSDLIWWPSWSWFGWGLFGVLDFLFGLPASFFFFLY
ncbi:MAG: hypothetical protein N0A16_01240 [Blastocatellia bacterium]|nr:hypothetical protein [Blastocatellia bacterium]MCS7156338.1 hypothetical protein [Blastocatellia bacterium]MCX7751311.1 hypothetical protein [Blastocatellia bacterium]MDW8169024.1 hypothetical protein [Acidobacteriota bacterium]MDW8256384.1 hypothetical protein [Acidobacteriota bacterium]